ncbi:hypothetical protein F2P81_004263 [Scophthalmus maximus]|uniref:Uncharacterized protein n=1 Tax=Scophthalmus maximus TaxID=52904 RepID=A0A6A4T5R3_SCOMX|nr:hypothetical protein F2P81_004263 [Scophthalmus maximus]
MTKQRAAVVSDWTSAGLRGPAWTQLAAVRVQVIGTFGGRQCKQRRVPKGVHAPEGDGQKTRSSGKKTELINPSPDCSVLKYLKTRHDFDNYFVTEKTTNNRFSNLAAHEYEYQLHKRHGKIISLTAARTSTEIFRRVPVQQFTSRQQNARLQVTHQLSSFQTELGPVKNLARNCNRLNQQIWIFLFLLSSLITVICDQLRPRRCNIDRVGIHSHRIRDVEELL